MYVSRLVREHFSKYITERLKLLESLLLELHDVDNRLKMELLSLTSMIDADLGEGNASGAEDSQFLSNSNTCPVSRPEAHTPYELVDLGTVPGFEDFTEMGDVDMDESTPVPGISRSVEPQQAEYPVNYLFGLITDTSLTVPSTKH
ncbi:hypothetical protein FGIG_02619 [Fasciola gigantica]|uniref:Uncharacterized protein n=1 Tax=Fasciola gigantica TaxID=46835 RepID=A0A504YQQ7_FASGI|nr:hypothetical protein FGIG_02619 [Fasciola gigantica]